MPAPGHSPRREKRENASDAENNEQAFGSRSRASKGSLPLGSGPAPDTSPPNKASQTCLIKEHLDKVLTSTEFKSAPQLRAFLRFIVQASLNNRKQDLKGYKIAVEALGRDHGFDPNTDPIVRVEAARLRSRLQKYYSGTGISDAIRITVPKGGYAPAFHDVSAPDILPEPSQLTPARPAPVASNDDGLSPAEANAPQSGCAQLAPLNSSTRTASGTRLAKAGEFFLKPHYSLLWVLCAGAAFFLAGYLAGRG